MNDIDLSMRGYRYAIKSGEARTLDEAKDLVVVMMDVAVMSREHVACFRDTAFSHNVFEKLKKWTRKFYFVAPLLRNGFLIYGRRQPLVADE